MSEKRKMKRTSLETKDQIIALMKQGYNGKQIDQKLGLGDGTASYHILKYKKGHQPPELISHVTTKRPETIAVSIVTEKKNTEAPKNKHNHFGPRLTDEQKNKMVDMYVQGASCKKIAEEVGCHFTTPGQYMKKLKERNQYKREVAKACKRVGIDKAMARESKGFKIAGANKKQLELPIKANNEIKAPSTISELEKLKIENELMRKLIVQGRMV